METRWYVHPKNGDTNKVIAAHLHKDENATEAVPCKNGNPRDMWLVEHSFITTLNNNRDAYNLKYDVYVRHGNAHAHLWRFEQKKRTKKEKRKIIAELQRRRKAA